MKYTNQQINPILITGIERSGSSIVARIIASCGTFTGKVTEMQENKGIRNLIGSYFEDNFGISEKQQTPFPPIGQLPIPSGVGKLIENLVALEGKKEDQKWMYKSHRIAQIYPIWQYAFPNAKYIIVRRRTTDIIQSCLKTGFMTAYDTQEGWLGWIHEQEKLFVGMIEAGLNCKQIWPERMVYGDYSQVYEMLEWLGLEWNDNIVGLVTPLLKNSSIQKERS